MAIDTPINTPTLPRETVTDFDPQDYIVLFRNGCFVFIPHNSFTTELKDIFIPYTGTTTDKPVTGYISFRKNEDTNETIIDDESVISKGEIEGNLTSIKGDLLDVVSSSGSVMTNIKYGAARLVGNALQFYKEPGALPDEIDINSADTEYRSDYIIIRKQNLQYPVLLFYGNRPGTIATLEDLEDAINEIIDNPSIKNRILTIGNVTYSNSKVTIGVHSLGTNTWVINGTIYSTNTPTVLDVPANSAQSLNLIGNTVRIDLVVATPDGFKLLVGTENINALEHPMFNEEESIFVTRLFVGQKLVSGIIRIGEISSTEKTITLGLHDSGTNAVMIDGIVYQKNSGDIFSFTPVTTGIKSLIVYALPTTQIFYLAEGEEGEQVIDPELPVGALIVRYIIATPDGVIINPEPNFNDYKLKAQDGWRQIPIAGNTPTFIGLSGVESSFELSASLNASSPIIAGFKKSEFQTSGTPPEWDGKIFLLRNISEVDITLEEITPPIDSANTYYTFESGVSKTLKPNYFCILKLKGEEIVIVYIQEDTRWSLTGNTATTTDYIGTNNNVDVVFKRNKILAGKIQAGTKSIAYGERALEAIFSDPNSQALSNVAFGNGALRYNTGNNNVAVGYNALRGVSGQSIGDWNVAYGLGALQNLTTGTYNKAVGGYALQKLTTGGRNLAFGYRAGGELLTGSGNVFIGHMSGLTITSGNYNIIIGDSCDLASANASRQMNIGNTIWGLTMNQTATATTGKIGINFSTPTNALHVFSPTPGALKLVDGTQAAGYVLMSDANGVGKWTKLEYDEQIEAIKDGRDYLTTEVNTGALFQYPSGQKKLIYRKLFHGTIDNNGEWNVKHLADIERLVHEESYLVLIRDQFTHEFIKLKLGDSGDIDMNSAVGSTDVTFIQTNNLLSISNTEISVSCSQKTFISGNPLTKHPANMGVNVYVIIEYTKSTDSFIN
ncbi:MAG: hypothetical protein LBE36_06660 [Flavobacteriaceae bacterium]|jgi:hypothetical protein|nr:hypothetical protein [Flavobacteriaceae bacterium]